MNGTIKVRTHGLERPYHPFQIISWFVTAYTSIIFCILIIPEYQDIERILYIIIFSILLVLYLCIGYQVSKSDPTDPSILLFQSCKDHKYNLYSQLLELEESNDRFCTICQCPVNTLSKHCVRCGRCTIGFDHHCKWVNNCIGEKNYLKFALLISMVETFYLFILSNCTYLLSVSFYNGHSGVSEFVKLGSAFYYTDLVLVIIAIVLCATITVSNGYLIIFHIFIKIRGITTYQFFLQRMNKVEPDMNSCELESPASKKVTTAFFANNEQKNNLDITSMMGK